MSSCRRNSSNTLSLTAYLLTKRPTCKTARGASAIRLKYLLKITGRLDLIVAEFRLEGLPVVQEQSEMARPGPLWARRGRRGSCLGRHRGLRPAAQGSK